MARAARALAGRAVRERCLGTPGFVVILIVDVLSDKLCGSRCTKRQIMRVEILCSETSHIIHHWKDPGEAVRAVDWCQV